MFKVVAEATTLRLSYKNVLKIDNLQGFSRLTKLCLDNNIIESIRFDEGLARCEILISVCVV